MKFFLSQTFLKPAKAVYLWLIALCIGAIFCAGAFSASVIFNAESFGVNLARFSAGVLMSEIFSRLNILLIFLAFVMTFYEILSAKLATLARIHKILLGVSSAISVLCIFFLHALFFAKNYCVAKTRRICHPKR